MIKLRNIFAIVVLACLAACGGNGDTPKKEALKAPEGLKLHSKGDDSFTFQWDSVEGALSYDWQLLDESGNASLDGNVTKRNVTVAPVSKGVNYKFRVRSVGEDETSPWSASVDALIEVVAPPVPGPGEDEISYDDFKLPANEESGAARAFPGAEGGGMYTTGGRGGAVYHVTNLNDSGEGSLRWAIGQKGARTIVFDVAGIIQLQSSIKISNGNVTIAGQTAPGGGICLKNYTVNVNADNVIIRYLHFRLGDEGPNAGDGEDCIWGRYLSNVILDHCSMSWSIDECASFYGNQNFTMQWCILTESMNDSAHSKGEHGYGGIWGGKDASFHHNMLANHHSRNPRIDHPEIYPKSNGAFDWSKRGNVDLRNLVIYNWGDNSTYGGEGGHYNFVNCWYRPGPDSKDRHYFVDAYSIYSSSKTNYGYPALYLSGNLNTAYSDISSNNLVHGVYFHDAGNYDVPADYSFLTSPLHISGPDGKTVYTTTHTAEKGKLAVLTYGGDVLHRDSVDERAVAGVRQNTGKIINTPAEVGGWPSYTASAEQLAKVADADGDGMPDWFETACGLNPASGADGAAITLDKKGRYTNLEMYLHYLVRDITAAQTEGGNYTTL